MSVVVFDGKELAADSYLSSGGVLAKCNKLGRNGNFTYAFVGAPALCQHMVSRLAAVWPEMEEWNEYSMELQGHLIDEVTRVLILPHDDTESMWLLEAGLPALQLDRQPIYLGADEGIGIFNWCKAAYPVGYYAEPCVRMCIEGSKVSAEPYAVYPIQVLDDRAVINKE